MIQTITQVSLYERDFGLWLEETIARLKLGDIPDLDTENLIEELEGLANRDKREVRNRLKVLFEHLLKRYYVDMADCYRGWENTIDEQRDELRNLLKQSPSLKKYFDSGLDEVIQYSLRKVSKDYPSHQFPNQWEFSRDINVVLTAEFWEIGNDGAI